MRRLVIVLVVVAVLAVAADRLALLFAEQTIAGQIRSQQNLQEEPTVRLRGFPFLTQAFSGTYDGGTVAMRAVSAGKVRLRTLTVNLTGAHLPLSALLHRRINAVRVDRVAGSALITYADLNRAVGVPGLSFGAGPDGRLTARLLIAGSGLAIPGLGTTLPDAVSASAQIAVMGNQLRITAVRLAVAGRQVSPTVATAVLRRMSALLAVEQLPYGLRLSAVRVTGQGVVISVQGTRTVLRAVPAG